MRIISSVEMDEVAGGGMFDSVLGFLENLFGGGGGSSGPSCTPSSSTSNGVTTTQSCGGGGVSTVTVSGPGYFSQTVTSPNSGVSASGSYGPASVSGSYNGGYTTRTTTVINGRVYH